MFNFQKHWCFELLVRVYAKLFLWDHPITIHPCDSKDYQLAHKCIELQVYSSVRVDVFKFQPVIVKVCWLCRCLLECFPDRLRDTHPWPDFLLICPHFWSRTLSKSFPSRLHLWSGTLLKSFPGHLPNRLLPRAHMTSCHSESSLRSGLRSVIDPASSTTTFVYLSLTCFRCL